MKKILKNNLLFFYLMTCIIFIVLFLITGFINTFVTKSKIVLILLKTLCAWSSFYVLMIFFKRFYPNKTRKKFFKELFREVIDVRILLLIIFIQVALFVISLVVLSLVKNITISSMLETSLVTLTASFFINLISGPIGEEPGWRGFFLQELTKRRGFVKASILNGFLWEMQHLPLWFTMGYSPLKVLFYAVSFVVAITSATVVMGYIFLKKRNLIYCILLHQLVNYLFGAVYILDRCEIFIIYAILQLIVALIVIIIHNREVKYNG